MGAAFVFGYFILIGLLHQQLQLSFETVEVLLLPLKLPYNLYKTVFGLYYAHPYWLTIINFIADVLIYSALFYSIFTFFARRNTKRPIEGTETPPKPPVFH